MAEIIDYSSCIMSRANHLLNLDVKVLVISTTKHDAVLAL